MKPMMKKLTGVTLAIGLIAQGAMAADVTMRFAWWGGGERHEATLKAIKAFEAKNPGVTIKGEYSGWPGYVEKLTTQMAGGNEPDIMQINWAWISQFSKDGNGFYDMKKGGSIKLDDFTGEAWKTGMVNGKLNAVPISYTARVYLWNKTMWDKAGLPLPKTWDDLLHAGKVFEQKLGKGYHPLDGQLYDRVLMSHAYIYQKTGKPWIYPNQAKVALTEAEALDWVKFFNSMVSTGASSTQQYRVSSGGGDSERQTEQMPDWVSGKFAGNYTWDSTFKPRLSTPKGMTFDVGDFLTMPGAKNSGYFGRPSMMFAVSKNSKNAELATKFVNFLTTDAEAIKILGTVRGAPVSKTQMDVLLKDKKFTDLELKAMKQIQSAKIDIPSPLMEHNRIQQWVREVFEKAALGKISEQEAAKMLVDETNAQLRRLR
ncbi:MAG: hypothetical protein H6R07_2817 [Proteobacteria bacterium]|nr:hypothetical protein [Pseudomonadota bacterium]